MKKTGTFASENAVSSLKNVLKSPYLIFGGLEPISPQELCHKYALEAGLPEIKGYYGINLDTGEFLQND